MEPPQDQIDGWIASGARGDEAACAQMYQAFSPAVLRLTFGLLGDVQDAEDVTQETFVYAFRNLGRYRPDKSAFRTWLFTIAISRSRNQRRRRWFHLVPLEQWAGPAAGAQQREVELLLERRGVRRELWAALQALPPAIRESVVLRYLGELRYAEVGQALGCHPKTAESRVRLGLAALRRALRRRAAEWELAELLA